jgi:uncharacterized protein YecE (DUF72 family)
METKIRVGTSGFDYPEWRGLFYPADLSRTSFLAYYAGHFDTLELNFSYYRMPEERQLAALAERAGQGCLFSIKAHQSLTHEIDASGWKEALAEYRAALWPLLNAKSLGAVLFQFPSSFHYEPDRRRYLDALLREASGLPLVVEFRNHEWYNNRVFDALRDRGVSLAAVDLPDLLGLPPAVDLVTAPLAYIRLHGRNGETWWGSDAAARYDYLYDEAELDSWVERIRAMAPKAERILVYFNNHWKGQAPRNAATLKDLLRKGGLAP